ECISLSGLTPIADRWAFRAPGGGGHDRSVKVRARLALDNTPAAIDAALAGVGIARLLSYQIDHLLAKGKLRAVLERFEPAPRPVHLVHLPGAPVRLAAAFTALATSRLRDRLTRA